MIKSAASLAFAKVGCASSRLDHGFKFYIVRRGCASGRLISEFSGGGASFVSHQAPRSENLMFSFLAARAAKKYTKQLVVGQLGRWRVCKSSRLDEELDYIIREQAKLSSRDQAGC